MVYNTGNGASLHKLPDKSQIPEKNYKFQKKDWILLSKIEKKESEH